MFAHFRTIDVKAQLEDIWRWKQNRSIFIVRFVKVNSMVYLHSGILLHSFYSSFPYEILLLPAVACYTCANLWKLYTTVESIYLPLEHLTQHFQALLQPKGRKFCGKLFRLQHLECYGINEKMVHYFFILLQKNGLGKFVDQMWILYSVQSGCKILFTMTSKTDNKAYYAFHCTYCIYHASHITVATADCIWSQWVKVLRSKRNHLN